MTSSRARALLLVLAAASVAGCGRTSLDPFEDAAVPQRDGGGGRWRPLHGRRGLLRRPVLQRRGALRRGPLRGGRACRLRRRRRLHA
ncbi:MAG: hypothetical protein M5U28_49900 [Sandaracinaceae bacterium]|nr:hypothetical protein [Sandaracinaceae bacterium]